jgi:hypothetical protein
MRNSGAQQTILDTRRLPCHQAKPSSVYREPRTVGRWLSDDHPAQLARRLLDIGNGSVTMSSSEAARGPRQSIGP